MSRQESDRSRWPVVPTAFAALTFLVHLPVLHRYGFHHDELYFIACGNHPAFGYVDHPPLVPWIARVATALFGESVAGLRLPALLAGAGAVLLAGLLARRLGGGRFAQALACLAMLAAPVYLRSTNMLCIPAFEPLFWLGASLILVRIIDEDNPRLWPWLGLVVGLGLMNKHSMLFFGFGLAVGLLATPLRAQLRTRWPWIGGAVALLVFLPNLVWQIRNGWPTLQFLRGLNESVMAGISKIQFVVGQFLYLNPLASFVWIAGLVFLFSERGKRYRVLGWIWVAVCGLLLLTDSKIYYLAPAYPAVIAAGGVGLERALSAPARARWRPVAVGALVVGGLLFAPLSLPYLSIDSTDRFVTAVTFGAFGNVYELTGDLHGMFGWRERVDAVAEVWDSIPPDERAKAMILASGYGNAGAIDFLGRDLGLPHATSFAETYWMWGYPKGPIDTVIGVDFSKEFLTQVWEDVEVVESVDLENVNPDETPIDITICRHPKIPMERVWPQVRPW